MSVGNHASGHEWGRRLTTSQASPRTPRTPITNITLADNDGVFHGGGIYTLLAATRPSPTQPSRATRWRRSSENVGPGRRGGVWTRERRQDLAIFNSTINANTSASGAGAGIALVQGGDHLSLHNTIVTNNKDNGALNNCSFGSSSVVHDLGYSLSDDTTCNLIAVGDHQGAGVNPNLGSLNGNGGPVDGAPGSTYPTKTEALPQGSSAIDTGDPNNANNPATDERHISRPQGAADDVGAYEFVPRRPPPPRGCPRRAPDAGQAPGVVIPAYLLAIGALVVAGMAIAAHQRRRVWPHVEEEETDAPTRNQTGRAWPYPLAAAIAPMATPRVAQAVPTNANPTTITPDTMLDVASPTAPPSTSRASARCAGP